MPVTISITLPEQTRGVVVAHLFGPDGQLRERQEVVDGDLRLAADEDDVLAGRLLLAPDLGEEPSLATLERTNAFEPLIGVRDLPDHVVVPDPIVLRWPWCVCLVRGRVLRADGRPVCDARVHVCEVDAFPFVLHRLPDPDVLRLRDDLLRLQEHPLPRPPRPSPDPGPVELPPGPRVPGRFDVPDGPLDPTRGLPRFGARAITAGGLPARAGLRATDLTIADAPTLAPGLASQLRTDSPVMLRKVLAQEVTLLLPWLCFIPWIWQRLRCDEVAVVTTDEAGRFQAFFPHDCDDMPDLYFWVEFDLGDGWETVLRPPLRCNVRWDHDCADEVTLTVSDPRVPACGQTPTGQHDVNVLSLGREVAVREVHAATGTIDGAITGVGPVQLAFGGRVEPRVDFSPTLLAQGVTHYRWSYRRVTGPDGTSPAIAPGSEPIGGTWRPMTRPVVRHYRLASGGSTSYPVLALGPTSVSGTPDLFAIQDATTPAGDGQWRVLDEREDLASAHFVTTALAGSPTATDPVDHAAGLYELKLELFDASGNLVNWSSKGITPGITVQDAPFNAGVVTTTPAPAHNRVLVGGDTMGFTMRVFVDNSRCSGELQPVGGGVSPDPACGFSAYGSTATLVQLSFTAGRGEDDRFATYRHRLVRGVTTDVPAGSVDTVLGHADDGWTWSGSTYQRLVDVGTLVGACPSAAFAQQLSVLALVQDGYGRLSGLDAHDVAGFALTPTTP